MNQDVLREQLGCPSLVLVLRPEWAAQGLNVRAQLREALGAAIGADVNDLRKLPQHDRYSISITHCPTIGGYALADKPFAVGLDAENKSRVEARVVRRVCSEAELAEAPSPAALWTAKESLFKSLAGPRQPVLLSDLRIGDWTPIGSSEKLEENLVLAWKFSGFGGTVKNQFSGQGLVFSTPCAEIALFCRPSST